MLNDEGRNARQHSVQQRENQQNLWAISDRG